MTAELTPESEIRRCESNYRFTIVDLKARNTLKGDESDTFFAEGDALPPMDEIEDITVGRMEFAEDGPPTFTPGISMELNGAKTFIPGKVSRVQRKVVQRA